MALIVLLTVGVFEPLLCIVHCYFWLPLATQSAHAEYQHHHMHTAQAEAAPAAVLPAETAIGPSVPAPEGCTLHFGPLSGNRVPPLPQAIHEMMLPALILAVLLLLVAKRFYPSFPDPPPVFIAVPLRPPISLAA